MSRRINVPAAIVIVIAFSISLTWLSRATKAGEPWHKWFVQIVDPSGDVGRYNSLALDAAGNPRISYYDGTNGDLKLARWTGTAWNIQSVDTNGDVGWEPSIKIDSLDRPHVSYWDATNDDLKYAWYGSACTFVDTQKICTVPGWHIETVDSPGTVGRFSSLALDSSGRPHISYYDGTGQNLNYARWTGGAWNIQTVESTPDITGATGLFTSLALDSNDNPHISYLYQRACADPRYCEMDNLNYARWTGYAWDIQTAVQYGSVGFNSSLALDSSGYPHVTYYDDSQKMIKYAKWTGTALIIQDIASTLRRESSLALDSSNNPHICYFADGYLRYAKWTGTRWVAETIDSIASPPSGPSECSMSLDSSGNPQVSYYSYGAGLKHAVLYTEDYCPGCPVADAGADLHVSFGDAVTLDASASHDDRNPLSALTFSWTCVQGCGEYCEDQATHNGPIPLAEQVVLANTTSIVLPTGETILLGASQITGSHFSFKAPHRVGSIIFRVTVTDTDGLVASDYITVTVLENTKTAVFVSQLGGDDANAATMEHPVASMVRGIERALARRCSDNGNPCSTNMDCTSLATCLRSDVYVEEGTYDSTQTLIVQDGISMYGGFSGDGKWTRTAVTPTSIGGSPLAVVVDGVLMTATVIDGFYITAADGDSPGGWDAGSNSIGLYVARAGGKLKISNNVIHAGKGGNGGVTPGYTTPAAFGAPGQPGDWGGRGGGDTFGNTYGGAGGKEMNAGFAGGDGGGCGYICWFDLGVDTGGGGDGAPGHSPAGWTPAAGGKGGCASGLGCSEDGQPGGDGWPGSVGPAGAGGKASGQIVTTVFPSFGQWLGGNGRQGGVGLPGHGGGGGGAGDGNTEYLYEQGSYPGGGGGGGGQGGSPGLGGNGGAPGGASFGIFLVDTIDPYIVNNQIITDGGGNGAKGGDGQSGGEGGPQGFPGLTSDGKAGNGGPGGHGGHGGDGGGGGGGSGGASCGLYKAPDAEMFFANNCFSAVDCSHPLIAGAVGPAGVGGEGGFPYGDPGEEGIQQNTCPEEELSRELCTPPVPPQPVIPIPEWVWVECPTASCTAVFGSNWPGSDVVMTLISPSGRTIDRNTAAPDVIHELGPTHERYTILNVEQGNWTIQLYGADVPPEGESVSLSFAYKPANNQPVAICQDVTVQAGNECKAAASIDAGSYDPDRADPGVSVSFTPAGPYPLGKTEVTLRITDSQGASESCMGTLTVVDQTAPQITCPPDVVLSAGSDCRAATNLTATATDNCDPAPIITSNAPSSYPLWQTLVTFAAVDKAGNNSTCQARVVVLDKTAPTINVKSVTPAMLWPPNGKMVPVTVSVVASDNCGPAPSMKIISVSSNEPPNSDAVKSGDAVITDNLKLNLRAERNGSGTGRVYTIVVESTDSSRNSKTGTTTVTVPHDQRK